MKSNLSYEDEEKSLSEKSAAFVQYLTRRGYLISQTAINDDAEQRRREMAKRAYHNTELLLESYRDMVWAVESIPDQIASELEMPFATLDELIDRIDLEISMENKAMEGRIHSITESRLLIDRMNEAISVLKKKPKDGELLYRVIYETYMGDEIYESVYDLFYKLGMTRRKYYELRKKAIRLISLRLWSAPNNGAEPGQMHESGEVGGMEMPVFTSAVHTESGATVPEGEAPQFGAAFIPGAETGQMHESGEVGGIEMPANTGFVQPEGGVAGHEGEVPQFGAAFVPAAESGQVHEDGVSGGMEMPTYSAGSNDMYVPEGDAPQFGSAFASAPAGVHEVPEPSEGFSYGQDSSTGHVGSEIGHVADGDTVVSHIGGGNVGHTELPETAHISEPTYSGNGADGANAYEADSHAPQFGAGFVGGGNASGFDDGHYHGGADNGHYSGDSYHGGDHGGYAEAPLVAATFPNAQEGTMLRTVGDGVIEASSPDGGNTLWYNSAYFQEPDAPHSVMEAANGVQWYAMQQQAQAPQFESGVEAMQYNQAAFQNFMPGYDGQVAHVDGTHRLDGHFEVRNADGSGTAFYDTARYAAPRGDYQVMEDARGSQWYAIRGEAAVDRKPVFENGKAVYDDGKLRTVSVETVRYKQTPARFAEPQKRADIDRKPPRRKQ